MKYLRKVCVHDKVIAALNAEKEKYLNYEISISGVVNGNVCVRCHESEGLNSFGAPKISIIKMVDRRE